jgi:hypothetical protein
MIGNYSSIFVHSGGIATGSIAVGWDIVVTDEFINQRYIDMTFA